MQDEIDKQLRHSKKLSEIELNLDLKPLRCGFPTIENNDYIIANEGNLVIISGKPGHGKTAFSSNIALNVSRHTRVLYFSLEMTGRALKKRLLGVISGVPIKKLTEEVFKAKVASAIEEFKQLHFDIIDDKDLSVTEILSKCYDENNREKLGLVIIDYIGILNFDKSERHLGVASAAKRFKDELADRLKIPVLVLAQMKDGFNERYARAKMEYEKAKQYPTGANSKILNIRPTLEDIGESSGIGKAADTVMFIHRPCLLDPDEPKSLFKVYMGKVRDGEAIDFELEFSSTLTKFIDKVDHL